MPVVETRHGRVRGQTEQGVEVYRGIPYARPPVGELRFEAPVPPVPWAGVRDALRFSPAAPQMGTEAGPIGTVFRVIRGGISEDCLYLNVWTPRADASARLPVVVYVHGGAYVLGAGSTFLYNGSRFARSGVVVVTLNYRLGALGFLDLSRLAGDGGPPANVGILDQVAALEWVHENIDRFGGDPGNITLYGESAGAMSVGAHLGLGGRRRFRRAILASGATANVSTPEEGDYVSRRFLDALSIAPDDWRQILELPMESVLHAQRRALHGDLARFGNLPWQPTVDGVLIERQPLEAIRSGSAADVEVLVGTNREEWKLFVAGTPQLRFMRPEGLRRRVVEALGQGGGDPEAADELIARHRRRLRHSRRWPFEVWVRIRTEQFFRLPAIELAEAHAGGRGRTYCYRFDAPAPRFPRVLGSCHGIELGVVFGTFRHPYLRPIYGDRPATRRLSDELGQAWASFARSGRPSWQAGPDWQPFGLDGRETMLLRSGSRPAPGAEPVGRSAWRSSNTC